MFFIILPFTGDKSKIDLLRDAVKKGFEDVKSILGGKLPEVSEKTYDLVMKKFGEWQKDNDENLQIEEGGVEYLKVKQEIIEDDNKK